MAPQAKRKLKTNIDSLFPSGEFTIGEDTITIRPFSLEQWITLFKRFDSSLDKFVAAGITMQNYQEQDKAFKLISIIITDFPDVLSDATLIESEDLVSLPLEILMGLVAKVIEINLSSKDEFQKNYDCLTKILPKKNPEMISEA